MDATFSGAFWGAFFSFCFFILGSNLPKLIKWISLKFRTKKKINRLYQLLLLERNSSTFFFDLIEIFTFESIAEILKGSVLTTGDHLQFESRSWLVIIKNKIFETRLSIKDINSLMYNLDSNNNDINIEVLLGFIQYLELRCKQEKIKLKMTEKLQKAKQKLKSISSRKLQLN